MMIWARYDVDIGRSAGSTDEFYSKILLDRQNRDKKE